MLSSFLLFATTQLIQAQARPFNGLTGIDIRRDFLLTPKEAVGMLAPRVMCPATATHLEWSYDGDYVVVDRIDARSAEDSVRSTLDNQMQAPPADALRRELVVYSVRGEKVKSVVPITPSDVMYLTVQWLHGDDQFIVDYEQPVHDAEGRITGSTGTAALISPSGHITPLAHTTERESIGIHVSPTAPIMAIEQLDMTNGSRQLSLVRPNGTPIPEVILPDNYLDFEWAPDGGAFCRTFKRVKGSKPVINWFRVNLADGKCSPIGKEPNLTETAAPQDFDLQRLIYRIPNGDATSHVARGFALRSRSKTEVPQAIVTADGSEAILSPKHDAVAYISQGIAMVRQFMKMPKDQFVAARNAALRLAALNQAKQVALGLIMYANDYDDNLMSNSSNWQSALEPYLKDDTLTDGFVYTFAGGNMGTIESPAETILGYIDGPGGRAIAYSDGHCKWIPN